MFSHIQRCGVLQAQAADQHEWLKDTMDYLADRYPDLTDGQLATVELMGRRYLEPAVPHGAATRANNRDAWSFEAESDENLQDSAALAATV